MYMLLCMYNWQPTMQFIWDQAKSQRNLAKHKISFETATLAFEDPFVASQLDRVVDGEERWQTMGLVGGILVLMVAHTVHELEENDEVIRIISARRATRHERKQYDEQAQ